MTQFAPILEIIGNSLPGRCLRVCLVVLEIADFGQMLGITDLVGQLQVSRELVAPVVQLESAMQLQGRHECPLRVALPVRICSTHPLAER
jgi:hypothetical protein